MQILPDLSQYRRDLIASGAPSNLPLVPHRSAGLLSELPPPPPDRHGWPWNVETAPQTQTNICPLITIVIPSFQQGIYLEEAIRSVLLQNYPKLQCVIMDGGATDGSANIIERYRPWLSFARCAPDRGQSHAINLGFSITSGEIRGWLNSDDYYLPGALYRVAEAALNRGNFFYGDSLELNQATSSLRHVFAGYACYRYASFPGLIPSHGAFWRDAIHQPVWEEQHCAMDYELWIRLLRGTEVIHIPHPIGVLRVHAETKSASNVYQERWQEDAQRNGLAHPGLYTRKPWLQREFRLIQRWVRKLRSRGEAKKLHLLERQCGWSTHIKPSM